MKAEPFFGEYSYRPSSRPRTRDAATGPRTIPGQTLEAFPVVAVHCGVRVQREAVAHREPARVLVRSRRLDETQALLNGALLQLLEVILRSEGLELDCRDHFHNYDGHEDASTDSSPSRQRR